MYRSCTIFLSKPAFWFDREYRHTPSSKYMPIDAMLVRTANHIPNPGKLYPIVDKFLVEYQGVSEGR